MSLIRVLRSAAQVLTRTFYQDGVPTDAVGTVTVSVARLDGTVLHAANATKTPATVGIYTYTLAGGPTAPASLTWQLDHLDVTWTATLGGAVVSMVDRVEVVGGFMFGLAEARASDQSLDDLVRYPTADIAAKRIQVEQECERICRQAFVPRFHRERLSGRGTDRLGVKHPMLRTLRAVSVSGVAWSAADVAAVVVSESGMLTRPDGALWPAGVGNIVVEVEHGWDAPTQDLANVGMLRLRTLLNRPRSGVPDRVESYTNEAGTFRLSMPDRDKTGIPEVDAVYHSPAYRRERRAVFA